MDTLIAITVIAAPTFFLGLRVNSQYGSIFSVHSGWTLFRGAALLMCFSYIVFAILNGVPGVYEYNNSSAENRKFIVMFIIPGAAFSLAIFPKSVTDICRDYTNLAGDGYDWVIALLGWLVILLVSIVLIF